MKIRHFIFLAAIVAFSSCKTYKQNIMFKVDTYDSLLTPTWEESTYEIARFDELELNVFTSKGEILIDPNFELVDKPVQNTEELRPKLTYTVDEEGNAKLPMLGTVALAGMTLSEAESMLEDQYAVYYKDPFVKLNYLNKRVILLGGFGSHVIPLRSENMTVAEIIALSNRDDREIKAKSFRLIRGNDTYAMDFSTLEGYQSTKMRVEPGDIIYVEPVRRPFSEFLKDNAALITIFSSMAALIAVIVSIN
jgi:polysaccharide export outer membrane protein